MTWTWHEFPYSSLEAQLRVILPLNGDQLTVKFTFLYKNQFKLLYSDAPCGGDEPYTGRPLRHAKFIQKIYGYKDITLVTNRPFSFLPTPRH